MTKREAIRQTEQERALISLGFTSSEAETLRRISLTLHRWAEHECNGAIQRDGDKGDGRPFWYNTNTGRKIGPAPDRERGALARLKAIVEARNDRAIVQSVNCHHCGRTFHGRVTSPCAHCNAMVRLPNTHALTFYVQGDPRGAALYILRPGDVPAGADVSGYYSRGICVY